MNFRACFLSSSSSSSSPLVLDAIGVVVVGVDGGGVLQQKGRAEKCRAVNFSLFILLCILYRLLSSISMNPYGCSAMHSAAC